MPEEVYYLRIKKSYAADVIEDLQKMDAIELLSEPPMLDWQKKEAGNRLEELEEDPAKAPALEGGAMSSQEFKNWIEQAEAMPSVTLQQAKTKWAKKRKELQQRIK